MLVLKIECQNKGIILCDMCLILRSSVSILGPILGGFEMSSLNCDHVFTF